ncbi:MAG TPA: phosphotransferase [Acidimicrobiales bacterium]
MDFPDDPAFVSVLREFGITADALLGHGGEAWVFDLGDGRAMRILHPGGRAEDLTRRQHLVDELRRSHPPFALPEVLEIGDVSGRVFALERRLPGHSVLDALGFCTGIQRRRLVERYLDTAAMLGDLHLDARDGYGDLVGDDVITAATWHDYLVDRAATNLARSTRDFSTIDAHGLTDDLPEARGPAFVHLDAFGGNMLTDGSEITAVIDFGSTSVVGDRRFNPLAAAIYLASEEITPTATPADVDVAMSWLRAADLHELFEPTRRWLAAYWSFAVDDPKVLHWCRAVLL